MPRLRTNAEVIDRVAEVGLIRDLQDGASSALAEGEPGAAGETTITVDDGASFAQGQLVRIGAESSLEINVVQAVQEDEITLRLPLAYDHPEGTAVVQVGRVNLGEPTEEGVQVNSSADLNPIRIATSKLPYVRLLRGAEYTMEFSIVNFNLENLAAARGIPESNLAGEGTEQEPQVLRLTSDLLSSALNESMYFKGVRKDGTTFEIQAWAVDMDPSDDQTFASAEGTPLRINGSAKNIQATIPALP